MIIEAVLGILKESYYLLNKMSPYLLFGFLFAGVLHIFFDTKTVRTHLGKSSIFSVLKASLFGIPLPLCSCSVIPAAMSLRKEGASRGAALSFLISTPTTGVDSIFATYSLLGGIFTIYRIIASFVTGTISGIMANFFIKEDTPAVKEESAKCKFCEEEGEHAHSFSHRMQAVFHYAFGDILKDSGLALIAGLLIGGVLAYFVPEEFIKTYLGSGITAMLVMLLVGIPMYVCATASIPIAAALLVKGINPGAAFVFLVAGPATNIVTMMVVAKNLGIKALVIYLGSIIAGSIALGILLDFLYAALYRGDIASEIVNRPMLIPQWLSLFSSAILLILIIFNLIPIKGHTHHH